MLCAEFVGRDGELVRVRNRIDALAEGHGGVLAVVAPAGKTTLTHLLPTTPKGDLLDELVSRLGAPYGKQPKTTGRGESLWLRMSEFVDLLGDLADANRVELICEIRAHSIGHERQHLNLITHALCVNSLAVRRHARRRGDPPDAVQAA